MLVAFGYTPGEYHKQSECAKVNQSEIIALGDALRRDQIPDKSVQQKTNEYESKRDFAATCGDIAAQWTVANLTWRAFWIGLVGLGALIWTLYETRRASAAAGETLNVARDTLKEARSSTRRELRAYMHCEQPRISHTADGENLCIFLKFKFKNTGQTPAYVVTANGAMMTMIKGAVVGGNTPVKAGHFTQIASGIEKEGTAEIEVNISAVNDPSGNFVDGASLYCLLGIQYFDIYSVGHNRKEDKFSDAFVFNCDLPIQQHKMSYAIISETNKKTV